MVIPLLVTACDRPAAAPMDEGEKIAQATLRLLTSDGTPICIDNRTKGAPLAIFATMQTAPAASRRPLAWHKPAILRPTTELSSVELLRDSIGSQTAHLRDPETSAATLPWSMQRRLNAGAVTLERAGAGESVTISSGWAPGVKARWWLLNRLSQHCSPTYTFSNPTWSGSAGYITVMTTHWGTTYAFDRTKAGWNPTGQWTNWLY